MVEIRYPLAEARRKTTIAAVRLLDAKGLVAKLNTSHLQVTEMMLLMIQDGMGAMAYGQYGGSTPNPTMNAVINPNDDPESTRIWNRDNVAETDLAQYEAELDVAFKALDRADEIRRRYMSANLEMWMRLDPTDFCRLHWFIMHREPELKNVIPRRVVGDLCKDCNQFRLDNGRPPEPLELDKFIQSGGRAWPHRLWDPKERRAV